MTPADLQQREIARLRALVDELRDEIAALRHDKPSEQREEQEMTLQVALGIAPRISAMVLALYDAYPKPVTKHQMHVAVSGGVEPKTFPEIVDVHLSRLRAQIGKEAVVNVWARGCVLSPEGHEIVRKALAGEPVKLQPREPKCRLLDEAQVAMIRSAGSRWEALGLGERFGVSGRTAERVYYGCKAAQ